MCISTITIVLRNQDRNELRKCHCNAWTFRCQHLFVRNGGTTKQRDCKWGEVGLENFVGSDQLSPDFAWQSSIYKEPTLCMEEGYGHTMSWTLSSCLQSSAVSEILISLSSHPCRYQPLLGGDQLSLLIQCAAGNSNKWKKTMQGMSV